MTHQCDCAAAVLYPCACAALLSIWVVLVGAQPPVHVNISLTSPSGFKRNLRVFRVLGKASAKEEFYDEKEFNTDVQRISDNTDEIPTIGEGEVTGSTVVKEEVTSLEEETECSFYFYQLFCAREHKRTSKDVPLPSKNYKCQKPHRKMWRRKNGKSKRIKKKRQKRLTSVVPGVDRTWDLGYIPYNFTSPLIFSRGYPNNAMGRMRAKNHYHYWSCLRFVQWTPTLHVELGLNHDNYLDHDLTSSSGCSSVLGNTGLSGQKIFCCWDNACVHELGHALGQAHEHRNTLGEESLTVNFDNISPNSWGQFFPRDVYTSNHYGRYDLASQMHYNVYDGSKNGKKVFTMNDPDEEFLITNDDPYDFYFMYDVSTSHQCPDLVCSDFTLECNNGGYPSYIRDRCTCRCPDGLDPATGCVTKYNGDRTQVGEGWPWGSFTLLATTIYNGCPAGFYPGYITQHSTPFTSKTGSNVVHASVAYTDGNGLSKDISYVFCTKRNTAENGRSPTWPQGHYCIYRQDSTCPDGFMEGNICYADVTAPSNIHGDVPDGIYTKNVTFEFCCRSDSSVSKDTPLDLPNDTPFILLQVLNGCHPIQGMTVTKEWFTVKSPALTSGFVPRNLRDSHRLHYCYYQPDNYDATRSFSLWPTEAFTMFSPLTGCPENFLGGHFTQHATKVGVSSPITLEASINTEKTQITHKFCTKEATDNITATFSWMPGQYCLFTAGETCPEGFESGKVIFADTSAPDGLSGVLPAGNYTMTTELHFCCREDGFSRNPIVLPTSEPFTLLQANVYSSGRQCQQVLDMTASEEYYTIDTGSVQKSGAYPLITSSWGTYYIHVCVYYPTNFDCGGVLDLDVNNPSITIESPNDGVNYLNNLTCFWHIFSPQGTRVVLNFDKFDLVENTDGTCDDCLEIKNKKPGYFGECICGQNLEYSVVSESNWMALTFYSNLAYRSSGFKVTAKLVYDSDSCLVGKGEGYRGTWSYTKRNYECLNWTEVTHCPHNPFRPDDLDDDLINNYCRNPGDGIKPWCYIQSDGCRRDYCDVCGIEKCYNVFYDCNERLAEDPLYCTNDPEASRGCRQMCGLCNTEKLPPASVVTCNTPKTPNDADPLEPLLSVYHYGQNVSFVCKADSSTVQTRHCLSDGTWSMEGENGGFVCGRCPDGWTPFGRRCFKWYNVQEDRSTAQGVCATEGASLTSVRDAQHLKFLKTMTPGAQRFWIGIKDGVWEEDGSAAIYTNYGWGDWFSCAYMKSDDTYWVGVDCDAAEFLGFFCSFPMKGRKINQDTTSHCSQIIQEYPRVCTENFDFAFNVCPKTCGYSYNDEHYNDKTWPEGPFSLLGTRSGCPEGMAYGGLRQTTQWATLKDVSDISDAAVTKLGMWSWPLYMWIDKTEYEFCSVTDQGGAPWPLGKYCIYRQGDVCPIGFNEGSIQYDDVADPIKLNGTLPSGDYVQNTRMDFCCRRDGDVSVEMDLPNDKPFILFREATNCQSIAGMDVDKQWSTIMNFIETNGSTVMQLIGDVPAINTWYNKFYELHYCYYKPKSQGAVSCVAPVVPDHTFQLKPVYGKTSPNNTVTPGNVVEYACVDQYIQVGGDLTRVCQIDGTLTGSPPICRVMSGLILPHYDVDIIPRRFIPWGGYLYTANNTGMRIPQAGVVVAWEFWSEFNGSAALFVLRPASGDDHFFTVVGFNDIPETLAYRRRLVNITADDQIHTEADDVIGVYYYYPRRGGIPYTPCDPAENGNVYGNTRRSSFAWSPASFVVGGQSYEFMQDNPCVIFSVKAYIDYAPVS